MHENKKKIVNHDSQLKNKNKNSLEVALEVDTGFFLLLACGELHDGPKATLKIVALPGQKS